MFKKKVVFVIGAGASCEINLPDSKTLKSQIAKMVGFDFERYQLTSGDSIIYEAIKLHVGGQENADVMPFVNGGRKIKEAISYVPSIDSFIDNHYGDTEIELCGKLGICRAILKAEKRSFVYLDPKFAASKMKVEKIEATWIGQLFKLLTANIRHDNLDNIFENVTFIVFNYDRCIEHYFYNSLKALFKIQDHEAARIVQSINIIHPYGIVGSLPWQEKEGPFPFAGEAEAYQLLQLSRQIKTYSEQVKEQIIISPIRSAIEKAEAVIFLGFAFHPQNVEILTPLVKSPGKKVFSTGFEVSEENCIAIQQTMRGVLHMEKRGTETYFRAGYKCANLFEDYSYVFRGL